MQQAERSNGESVSQHVPKRAIAAILLRAESIPMLDSFAPAPEASRPGTELKVHSGLAQHVASPAIVVARDQGHGYARISQIHQCREHAHAGSRHDGLPLEPELE